MNNVKIISKTTHQGLESAIDNGQISLTEDSVVMLNLDYKTIQALTQDGNDLVIRLTTGEQIVVKAFFNGPNYLSNNTLIIEDTNSGISNYINFGTILKNKLVPFYA